MGPEILSGVFLLFFFGLPCVLVCWLVRGLGLVFFCNIRNLKLRLGEVQLLEFHMIVLIHSTV